MRRRARFYSAVLAAILLAAAISLPEAAAASLSDPASGESAQSGAEAEGQERVLGSSSIVGNSAFLFWDTSVSELVKQAQSGSGDGQGGAASEIGAALPVLERFPKYTVVDERVVADGAYYRNKTLGEMTPQAGLEEIGRFSFARSSLTKITLLRGVREIRYGAFYHCDSLESVLLPETVIRVEPEAFSHTAWMRNFQESGETFLVSGSVLIAYNGNQAEVEIPKGMRVIAAGVFAGREEIETLKLPDSLRVIGEGAFENCANLRQVDLGEGVEQILDRAFSGCGSLEALEVPASVKSVGLAAFGSLEPVYEGSAPARTYELSASRLANGAYRGLGEEELTPQVTVLGIESAMAELEGAQRAYTLQVEKQKNSQMMKAAWERVLKGEVPADMEVYSLQLTDSSKIPITDLSGSGLTVMLPAPKALAGKELGLVTLDRNGQLEALRVDRAVYAGTEYLCFRITKVSAVGVYGKGEASPVTE